MQTTITWQSVALISDIFFNDVFIHVSWIYLQIFQDAYDVLIIGCDCNMMMCTYGEMKKREQL